MQSGTKFSPRKYLRIFFFFQQNFFLTIFFPTEFCLRLNLSRTEFCLQLHTAVVFCMQSFNFLFKIDVVFWQFKKET